MSRAGRKSDRNVLAGKRLGWAISKIADTTGMTIESICSMKEWRQIYPCRGLQKALVPGLNMEFRRSLRK
jgi:hypothetical protein